MAVPQSQALLLDGKMKLNDPLWLRGKCGIVHCRETKEAEAEMEEYPYEIFWSYQSREGWSTQKRWEKLLAL